MRRWQIAAAVAGLALALAGAALASFTQHSNITLTANGSGDSTGISALVYSVTQPAGQAPWVAKKLTISFPTGTKFALGGVKPCTFSRSQIEHQGKSCPSSSKIGSGSASAFPVKNGKTYSSVSGKVAAYAAGTNKMILVVTVTKPVKKTTVIDETTSGRVLSITVPPLTATVGGQTFNVVLYKLQLDVPKRGSDNSPLIKAGKCTKGQWVVKTHFVYTNGHTKDVTYKSGFCS